MKLETSKDPSLDFSSFNPEYRFDEPNLTTLVQPESDILRFRHIQDIRQPFRDNHLARQDADAHWNKSKELKKVASVPIAMWLEWEALGITDDPKALIKAIELNQDVKTTTRRL